MALEAKDLHGQTAELYAMIVDLEHRVAMLEAKPPGSQVRGQAPGSIPGSSPGTGTGSSEEKPAPGAPRKK